MEQDDMKAITREKLKSLTFDEWMDVHAEMKRFVGHKEHVEFLLDQAEKVCSFLPRLEELMEQAKAKGDQEAYENALMEMFFWAKLYLLGRKLKAW